MSGLEIVGVVASTFQLAEIGIKLSVKLCSFYRQIKDADHSAQRLASDVSLTCSILHQLGKALEQDSQTKLCSQQAFLTALEVLGECEKIFKQIEEAIERKDPVSGRNKWERGTRRLTMVILGPDLDVLKSHLDRLKSTMLLMLNVIMYARDIKRTSDHSSLESQRQLIETLLREKIETEATLKRLIKVANAQPNRDRDSTFSISTLIAQPDLTAWQQPTENEIDKYYKLVKSLLTEIDACQANLQQDRHSRIRDGMVDIHKAELAIFQQSHGAAAVQAFDGSFSKIYNRSLDRDGTSLPLSHESHDDFDTYNDVYRGNHHRRRHDRDRSQSPRRPNRPSEKMPAAGLESALLGAGYSDNLDYDYLPGSGRYRYAFDFSPNDSAEPYSKYWHDDVSENGKQLYLDPGMIRDRQRRRHSREQVHDSDAFTDDEDLRNYRREPNPKSHRNMQRDTDPASALNRLKCHCEDAHHSSSCSERMSGHRHTVSHQSTPIYGEDDEETIVPVKSQMPKEVAALPKAICKPPPDSFPEEPNPVREGVAPLKDAHKKGIPLSSRSTKIDRRLVIPEALDAGNEQYEVQPDYVTVQRVLSKTEIQEYVQKTQEIRDERYRDYIIERRPRRDEDRRHGRSGESSSDAEDEDSAKPICIELSLRPDPAVNPCEDLPGGQGENPNDSVNNKYDGTEDTPTDTDTLLEEKAPDLSDSKREATSDTKGPSKHVVLDTLEDLVFSWTTLSRDMIQI